jgi:diguanylate cyclase (GGDEF)-like protein/PAS domain S-box-containing protein
LLVENSADMVALLDPTGVITFVNGAVTRRGGYVVEELLGRPALELVHPDDVDRVQAALADVVGGERHTCSLTFRFRSRDGGYSWFDGRAVNLVDEPAVGAILVSLHDVTQRVETEEQLAHQATHDPLTGVPNRALFLDRLAHLLEHARRHHRLVAVLFWDIDQFKAVNDRGGHAVGDSLLKEVATCAQATLRGEDTVARVGGDEFLACAVVADQSQVFALAERLHQALMIDVALPKERIHVTASIGVAFGIESAPEQMVVEADHAMYDAKRRGGRGISVVSLDRGAADGTGRVRYLDQPAS